MTSIVRAQASVSKGVTGVANVRFGSKADICSAIGHVRSSPESGHMRRNKSCLLWANSGHGQFKRPSQLSATKGNEPTLVRPWSWGILVYPPILHNNFEVLGGVGDQVDILQWIAID